MPFDFQDDYIREQRIFQTIRNVTKAKLFIFLNTQFRGQSRPYITTEQTMRLLNLKNINYTWNLLKEFCDLGLLEKVRVKNVKFLTFVPKNLDDYQHFIDYARNIISSKSPKA